MFLDDKIELSLIKSVNCHSARFWLLASVFPEEDKTAVTNNVIEGSAPLCMHATQRYIQNDGALMAAILTFLKKTSLTYVMDNNKKSILWTHHKDAGKKEKMKTYAFMYHTFTTAHLARWL